MVQTNLKGRGECITSVTGIHSMLPFYKKWGVDMNLTAEGAIPL